MTTHRSVGAWARQQVVPLLELLGLTSLAVAQPLFDVFGRNADAFVAEGARPRDVVIFALAVTLGPAVVLWVVEVVLSVPGDRVRRVAHLGFLGLLAALVVTVVMKRTIESFDFWTDLKRTVAAVVAGALFVVAYVRFQPVRAWLRYLAVAVPTFLLLFLLGSSAAKLVNPVDLPDLASVQVRRPAPIVMIVLDELPTKSILDGRQGVDGDLFPGFAQLARSGTWYRNNTTVAPLTGVAIPPVLTGRYPDHDALPIWAEYPRSLFSLLGDTYDIRVSETVTRLCPPSQCVSANEAPTSRVLWSLGSTATDVWRGLAEPWSRPPELTFDVGNIPHHDPRSQAEDFIDSFAASDRPRFDFMHIVLPHHGFRFMPSGATYVAPVIPRGLDGDHHWSDAGLAEEARRRHLLQLQYADSILQDALERLRDLGTYDESLIVVTADHGISFTEGESLRAISPGNHDDIMWVPLFVKAPHQADGQVVDAPTRTIDIMPTVASIVGVEVPWEVDGVPASRPRPMSDDPRILNLRRRNGRPEGDYVTADGEARYRDVLRAGPPSTRGDPRLRLFRSEPHGDLVGRRVDEMAIGNAMPFRADLSFRPEPTVRGGGAPVPVFYEGTMPGGPPLEIAVAVNDTIGAVTGVFNSYLLRAFSTVVPEHLLRRGRNEIRLFAVTGTRPTLQPIPVSSTSP